MSLYLCERHGRRYLAEPPKCPGCERADPPPFLRPALVKHERKMARWLAKQIANIPYTLRKGKDGK